MSRKHWTDEKLFSRLLNNKSERTYWENIRELHSRGNDFVFQKSYELAKSNLVKEKVIGINILAQLGAGKRPFEKETLELYFELLKNEVNSEVLWSILYGIGHNNYQTLTKSQIEFLATFKEHKDEYVREGLVSALSGVEDPIAIDTEIFLMQDKISTIRDWATFSIGTIIERNNKKIRIALWKRVNDKDQVTKLEAIVGLAKRKDVQIKEVIKSEFMSGEIDILLIDAVEEWNDKDFLPLLKQSLARYKKDTSRNQVWLSDLENCIEKLENQT